MTQNLPFLKTNNVIKKRKKLLTRHQTTNTAGSYGEEMQCMASICCLATPTPPQEDQRLVMSGVEHRTIGSL